MKLLYVWPVVVYSWYTGKDFPLHEQAPIEVVVLRYISPLGKITWLEHSEAQ